MRKFLTILLLFSVALSFSGCIDLKSIIKSNSSSDAVSSESSSSLTTSSESPVSSAVVIDKNAFEYYAESYEKTNAIETGKIEYEIEQVLNMTGMSMTTTITSKSLSSKKDGVNVHYDVATTENYAGSYTIELFVDGDINYLKDTYNPWEIVSDDELAEILGDSAENLKDIFPVKFDKECVISHGAEMDSGKLKLSFVFGNNAFTSKVLRSLREQGIENPKLKSGSAEIFLNDEGYMTDISIMIEYSATIEGKTVTFTEDYKYTLSDHNKIFEIKRPSDLNENDI